MYKIIRYFLFLFDPEKINHFTFNLIKIGYKIPLISWFWTTRFCIRDKKLERKVFGLNFPNAVGLAAGFDKDAKLIDELSSFGFGFIEIGTLTPKPQEGNPKPRLFRLKEDSGIINRMGFNNNGVDDAINRLKKRKSNIIIGGNIGKNKLTPNENANKDYIISFNSLFPYVDYFVVNVSSPNTPGLRDLQEKKPLTNLLNSLQKLNNNKKQRKPILLKIAPDLTNEQLNDIIQIIKDTKIDGVIATNTTIDRSSLKTNKNKVKSIGNGGLSGVPVKERSTQVIRYLSEKSNSSFPIIGVGGIHSEADALEKIKAGASLVQIYTGFVYEGPSLVKRINKSMLKDEF